MNIEQEIQAKGLTAPRVTQARIADLMDRIVFTFDVRPNGSTTTLAHAFLDGNFYLATGVSACVSVENFDAELGKSIATRGAKAAAEEKLWELEGYALRERLAMTAAARDVLAERRRQIDEGWVPEHDDEHDAGELAAAAACYAGNAAGYVWNGEWPSEVWPWEREWWKPTTPRRDLVKAGALILAEIERLDRAAAKEAA